MNFQTCISLPARLLPGVCLAEIERLNDEIYQADDIVDDVTVEVEFTPGTSVPANRNGHPDTWTPDESEPCEIETVAVVDDNGSYILPCSSLTAELVRTLEEAAREIQEADAANNPGGFKNLSESQGNVCAICKEPELKQVLSVDYCHKTGKVRGLLCNRCNTSIGKFGDDPILLQKAVDYLCQSQ